MGIIRLVSKLYSDDDNEKKKKGLFLIDPIVHTYSIPFFNHRMWGVIGLDFY